LDWPSLFRSGLKVANRLLESKRLARRKNMPKKSRKSRLKYKRPGHPQSLAMKEAGQSPQPLPALSEQASAAKSPMRTSEKPVRYSDIVSDLSVPLSRRWSYLHCLLSFILSSAKERAPKFGKTRDFYVQYFVLKYFKRLPSTKGDILQWLENTRAPV
jgi:hypothetical protein